MSRTLWLTGGLSMALLCVSGSTLAQESVSRTPFGDFSSAGLDDWKERSFEGNTDYQLVEDQGIRVLQGHTKGEASVLYQERKVDLRRTPIIEWSWKISGLYPGIDERSRNGDDFPARLYVVAKSGPLPWQTMAINYVWSSELPLEESWPNPFTDKARMVVVQTGADNLGSWVQQRRNVREDFKRFYNEDVSRINGYAVMVDGDNSKSEGTAWFGQIQFSAD